MSRSGEVVVTGTGCVSPFGDGVDRLWRGLFTGRAARRPTGFDVTGYRVAGVYEVPDRERGRDLPVELAREALAEAAAAAGLTGDRLREAGLVLASTSAGWHLPDEAFGLVPPRGGADRLAKEWPAAVLCSEHRLAGPCSVISNACASGTDALAWAAERIRTGAAAVMLVGAVDVVTEIVFAGFHAMRLLSRDRTRPFSPDRDGFVLAEGAAFLVLEDAATAATRGAPVRALLAGHGASCDAAHITTPAAAGIARSMRAALSDARRKPDEVAVVHAHGTASPASDAGEQQALAEVFGTSGVRARITAIKSAVGHTEGAAGLFSAVAAVEGITRRRLPPVLDVRPPTERPDRPGPSGRGTAVAPVLVHASGFGGVNSSVLFERHASRPPGPREAGAPGRPARPVRVMAAARADDAAVTGWPRRSDDDERPALAWPRNPEPDRTCRLLAEATAEVLRTAGPAAALLRAGGMYSGTRYGGQHHHRRMYEGLRAHGPRGVEPLDFALSTFNVPAAMAAVVLGIEGPTSTFLGAGGGVEGLASAAEAVAAGRASAMLAAGYDAPENRTCRDGAPEPEPLACVLAVADPAVLSGAGTVEISHVRRLPGGTEPPPDAVLAEAVQRANAPDAAVYLVGNERPVAGRSGWETLPGGSGAGRALWAHAEVVRRVAAGEHRSALVISTAGLTSAVVIGYRRCETP